MRLMGVNEVQETADSKKQETAFSESNSETHNKANGNPQREANHLPQGASGPHLQAAVENETDQRKLPLPLRIFGMLSIITGMLVALYCGGLIALTGMSFATGSLPGNATAATRIISGAQTVLSGLLAVAFVMFGIRLFLNKRKNAAHITEAMIVLIFAVMLCEVMLIGLNWRIIPHVAVGTLLVIMQSYLDPSLAGERQLQHKLRDMEVRTQAEEGTLGRDTTGRGYISLNFFNLFWIFTICSLLGLFVETAFHMIRIEPGVYEERAGILFGPFSPIYGVGGVLLTMALNRLHKANPVLIFLLSAVIGGAFECAASLFFEMAFGIRAWNYGDTFLSIDGRTNGEFMFWWGCLGVFWVKVCMPVILQLVNLIPWNWRYSLTTVCATLMIIDCSMTLMALDRWYQRSTGIAADNAIAAFIDEHFDNTYMEERFESMTMNPDSAARMH